MLGTGFSDQEPRRIERKLSRWTRFKWWLDTRRITIADALFVLGYVGTGIGVLWLFYQLETRPELQVSITTMTKGEFYLALLSVAMFILIFTPKNKQR